MKRPTNLRPLRPARRLFRAKTFIQRIAAMFWRWC